MLNIAILDDDALVLEAIVKILHTYEQNTTIDIQKNPFTDAKELLNRCHCFDIIFLDVELGKVNGIELAKKIRMTNKYVKIVFITGFTQYMSSAFRVHAFGFLEKPVKPKEVYAILNDAISYSNSETGTLVKFQAKNKMYTFYIHEIVYFEYSNRNVLIHTISGSKYELPGEKISNIAIQMKKYHFDVPHKSFVVNLDYIKDIKGYDVYMEGGSVIPLSQFNSKGFRKSLNEYLKQQI